MHPALATASGPRALLAITGAGRPGTHRTTGAVALAPVFPLALTGPSLAAAHPDTSYLRSSPTDSYRYHDTPGRRQL